MPTEVKNMAKSQIKSLFVLSPMDSGDLPLVYGVGHSGSLDEDTATLVGKMTDLQIKGWRDRATEEINVLEQRKQAIQIAQQKVAAALGEAAYGTWRDGEDD